MVAGSRVDGELIRHSPDSGGFEAKDRASDRLEQRKSRAAGINGDRRRRLAAPKRRSRHSSPLGAAALVSAPSCRRGIDKVHQQRPPKVIVLDLDFERVKGRSD